MKLIHGLIFVCVFGFLNLAWANYPTVWTLVNDTDDEVFLYCISHNPEDMPGATMFMENQVLNPKSSKTYTWYSYYNGGSGLNAGDWHCHVNDKRDVARIRGGVSADTHFGTYWGEHVTLITTKLLGFYHLDKVSVRF